MAIPYRIIVWSGFPFGLDDASWQSLCSILSSGSRCGVGVLIDWPASIQWPTFADTEKLTEFALLGRIQKSSSNGFDFSLDVLELKSLPGKIESPPDESTVAAIMDKHLVAAAKIGKRIVPFSSIASQPENQHSRSSADGLEIPIGISDSGRIQSLVLGEGTSQHVLIAGKTGSGKSSLLHTMISSAALEYPPEELRLVLLDFKKGVEFQVYSELQLSHTDIIGIESRREFGLSTLEYLDRILSARGEAFRQWGVQDLPSLKRKHPDIRLPRILIVIDEFQELFVEDDKISQQASMLMDRIVRQGRSFGL
ncbi:MAG: FtsK/SpoIIIE domain-containing protein, partial [Pirellula sp.]